MSMNLAWRNTITGKTEDFAFQTSTSVTYLVFAAKTLEDKVAILREALQPWIPDTTKRYYDTEEVLWAKEEVERILREFEYKYQSQWYELEII